MKRARINSDQVEHLAANLKVLRIARGMPQELLAHECELSVAYISLLERRKRVASLDTVERIARALGVDPRLLLAPPRLPSASRAV